MSSKKKKQKRSKEATKALRKWRQHEPLTAEEYHLLDQMNRGKRSVKTLRGGATGLRQQNRRRV